MTEEEVIQRIADLFDEVASIPRGVEKKIEGGTRRSVYMDEARSARWRALAASSAAGRPGLVLLTVC